MNNLLMPEIVLQFDKLEDWLKLLELCAVIFALPICGILTAVALSKIEIWFKKRKGDDDVAIFGDAGDY